MNTHVIFGLVALQLAAAQWGFEGYGGGGPSSCTKLQFWNGESCVTQLSYGKECGLAAYKGHVCGKTLRCKNRCVCSPGYFWNGKLCHKYLSDGAACRVSGYRGRVCAGSLRCLKGKCACKSPLVWLGSKCGPVPDFFKTGGSVGGGYGGGYGGGGGGYGAPKYGKFGYAAPKVLTGGCPNGWSPYHGSCYYFSRDRCSWWKAQMKCASYGGYLVIVDQSHENSYIRRYLSTFGVTQGAWMGLNDCLSPNKHHWKWGFSKKRCSKFDWYGNEPIYHSSGDYNCGLFWQNYQYHWHVGSCTQENYYVCEMKLGKPCRCQY